MSQETWIYQGRQSHGWFGHGTSPHEDDFRETGGLVGTSTPEERIRYVVSSLIGHIAHDARARWNFALRDRPTDALIKAMTVWQGQDGLSRDAFRNRFLDGYASDSMVDRLRAAIRGAVWGRTVGELGYAGNQLAAAAQSVGPDRWPRFVANLAERAAVAQIVGAPEHLGYLTPLDTVYAPISTILHRIAETTDETDIDVVDGKLRALIEIVKKKAPQTLPTELNPLTYGSRMHKMLADEVKAAGLRGVTVERSFIDGKAATYGEIGTVRVDVLLRDTAGRIVAVWDWKTGVNPSMSRARVTEIQIAVGKEYGMVPVRVISTGLGYVPR